MKKNDPFEALRDVLRNHPIIKTRPADWQRFLSCRRAFKLTLLDQWVPRRVCPQTNFRKTIHRALRVWHQTKDPVAMETLLDLSWPPNDTGLRAIRDRLRAESLLAAYIRMDRADPLKLTHSSGVFYASIVNPRNQKVARSFELSDEIDGVVHTDEGPFLLIHCPRQTWEGRDPDDWTDAATMLTAHYAGLFLGITLRGAYYNQVSLPVSGRNLEPGTLRRELAGFYEQPGHFRGVRQCFTPAGINSVLEELWSLTRFLQIAIKNNRFYPNRGHCRANGRTCDFLAFCKSGMDPEVARDRYRIQPR